MTADPFPGSTPLGSLLEAGIDMIQVPPPPGYRFSGLSPVWLLARMPDGTYWEGAGATSEEAVAGARARWRKQQLAVSLPRLHREYRRRLRHRRRKR